MGSQGQLKRCLLLSVLIALLAQASGYMVRNARSRARRAAASWSGDSRRTTSWSLQPGFNPSRDDSYNQRNGYGPAPWSPETSTAIKGDPVKCTSTANGGEGARGPSGTICFRQIDIICDDGEPGARERGAPGASGRRGVKGASPGDGSPPGFVCGPESPQLKGQPDEKGGPVGQPGPPGGGSCRRVRTIVCPDLP